MNGFIYREKYVQKGLNALGFLMNIGYVPYSNNLDGPGDRRRFVFAAQELNLSFEIANPNRIYDLIYVTSSGDMTRWIRYKKMNPNVKIVFEMVDSYLLEQSGMPRYFRGIGRYVSKRDVGLYINYKKAFTNMLRIADAAVCSTPIQKQSFLQHNKNVHVSLDYFGSEIFNTKKEHARHGKLKIVWEGQSHTLKNILEITNVLNELKDRIELTIVTDKFVSQPVSKYFSRPVNMFRKNTVDLIRSIKCNVIFREWDLSTYVADIDKCDLAIIPISNKDSLSWNKPENKLLLFWTIGIPVLTSGTPAYKRALKDASLDMWCENAQDWRTKILKISRMNDYEFRNVSLLGTQYVETNNNKEIIIDNWRNIFRSIGV